MNKLRFISERLFLKSVRLVGLISLWVFISASLGACSSFIVQSSGDMPGPTPTVYSGFAPASQNGGNEQSPSVLPEVSDLFSKTTPEATPIISPTQFAPTPTIEPTGQSGEGSLEPTLTSPSSYSESIPIIQDTPVITSDQSSTGDVTGWQANEDAITGASQFKHVYIYRDSFTPGWKAYDSWNINYTLGERRFVHGGRFAMVVTPIHDYGGLFINLSEASANTYSREDVAGVSFWINPGDNPMQPDDLAVTVIGSNDYPYWVKGDESVPIDNEQNFFSETRLSLLNFHNELQPHTWYQVLLWLDDLPFDPAYKYVTGFYIKNDAGFRHTFYIDDISLITYAK